MPTKYDPEAYDEAPAKPSASRQRSAKTPRVGLQQSVQESGDAPELGVVCCVCICVSVFVCLCNAARISYTSRAAL